MRSVLFCLSALLLPLAAAAQEAPGADTSGKITIAFEQTYADELGRGYDLVRAQRPADAIAIFDQIIAGYGKEHDERSALCAESVDQSLEVGAAALLARSLTDEVIVLGPAWCSALFGKAFALIDLRRPGEAEPLLLRAVAMAPLNAHYRNELAELHKNRREWQRTFDMFEEAHTLAQNPLSQSSPRVIARALRGMGYCKIELGQLDEAKSLFVRSQQHDPDNAGAKSELEYIASLQNRTS